MKFLNIKIYQNTKKSRFEKYNYLSVKGRVARFKNSKHGTIKKKI